MLISIGIKDDAKSKVCTAKEAIIDPLAGQCIAGGFEVRTTDENPFAFAEGVCRIDGWAACPFTDRAGHADDP